MSDLKQRLTRMRPEGWKIAGEARDEIERLQTELMKARGLYIDRGFELRLAERKLDAAMEALQNAGIGGVLLETRNKNEHITSDDDLLSDLMRYCRNKYAQIEEMK